MTDEELQPSPVSRLVQACQDGNKDRVKSLIEAHAHLAYTPAALHKACEFGYTRIVKFLLKKGAPLEGQGYLGATPLIAAATNGQLLCVCLLADKGAVLEAADQEGWTALHTASRFGHVLVIQFLLSRKVSPNPKTKQGWTPLHIASQYASDGLLRLLLGNGASLDALTKERWSALHFACKQGNLANVELLMAARKKKAKKRSSSYVPGRSPDRLTALLGKKELVDPKTRDGKTPLHIAAEGGFVEVVRFLLTEGAYSEALTLDGETACKLAEKHNHRPVVQFFEQLSSST